MIETALLTHFVAVAKTGSFTLAAERANTCRSVLTRSIKRLEDQVGTRLFDRTTRSVKLTAAGESLLADVESIAGRVALATGKARRIGQGGNTRLRIGLCVSAHSRTIAIAQTVARIRKAFPGIDLQPVGVSRKHMGEALRSAQVDVGFMVLDRGDTRDLEWQTLVKSPLMLWVPPSWDITASRVQLEQLRDRHWIFASPSVSPDLFEMQMLACREAGFTPQAYSHSEDFVAGVMIRSFEQGAVFIHNWDAPADDPCAKQIEQIPGYCYSEIVMAWAKDAQCDLIGDMQQIMREENEFAQNVYPLMTRDMLGIQ